MPWYMQWWVWGLFSGVFAPWLIWSRSIQVAFAKSSQTGFGLWSGLCVFTIPLCVGILFVSHLIVGK